MRRKISVYSEWPAEFGVIRYSLAESFNTLSLPVRYVKQRDILDRSALSPDTVLVLPGSPHGDGYRAQLGGAGNAIITDHVKSGGGLFTICGPTYLACKTYSYDRDDGTTPHFVSDFALLDAHAHGPLTELANPRKHWGGAWARHDVAMLTFHDDEGIQRDAGVCYSKGPRLRLNPGEDCTVMARFRDLAGHPPAIASKQIGRGVAVFCSVSLDVSGAQLKERFNPINDNLANAKTYVEELAGLEQSRNLLWNKVWRTLLHEPAGF